MSANDSDAGHTDSEVLQESTSASSHPRPSLPISHTPVQQGSCLAIPGIIISSRNENFISTCSIASY